MQFRDEAIKGYHTFLGGSKSYSFGTNWEFMKYKIRTLPIRSGKEIAKHKRENEEKNIHKIISLYENSNIDQEKRNKLLQLQLDLDQIYEYRNYIPMLRS